MLRRGGRGDGRRRRGPLRECPARRRRAVRPSDRRDVRPRPFRSGDGGPRPRRKGCPRSRSNTARASHAVLVGEGMAGGASMKAPTPAWSSPSTGSAPPRRPGEGRRGDSASGWPRPTSVSRYVATTRRRRRLGGAQDVAKQQQRRLGRPMEIVEDRAGQGSSAGSRPARRPPRRRAGTARSPDRNAAAPAGLGTRSASSGTRRASSPPYRPSRDEVSDRCGRRSAGALRRKAGRERRGPRRTGRPGRRHRPSWTRPASSAARRRLAHPGLAGQQSDAPLPGRRLLPQLTQAFQFGVAADEDPPDIGQQGRAWARPDPVGSQPTSQTATGSGRPLRSSGPCSVKVAVQRLAGECSGDLGGEDLARPGRGHEPGRLHDRHSEVVAAPRTWRRRRRPPPGWRGDVERPAGRWPAAWPPPPPPPRRPTGRQPSARPRCS